MRIALATAFACLALGLAAAPAPAFAQSSNVFDVDQTEQLPPTDEYNDIPIGIMLSSAEQDAAAKQAEATAAAAVDPNGTAVVTQDYTRKLNYDTILKLYNDGKYDQIVNTLQTLSNAGHQGAQELMGIMYRQGQGVPKDSEKAFDLLSKAAEANRPLAQHHLGVMYYQGEGVAADPVEALKWLHIAIVHYPDGPEKDRAKQDRDNIYAQLTRRDKDRAMQMTRDWLNKRGEGHLLDMQ
ncbi:MAG: tetratricopeptide repeat protein [Micavibrio sp.]|nr:tetratricopeptide repeat protein [Micavibrio sp.]